MSEKAEELIQLKLAAAGFGPLYDLLPDLIGLELGQRFTIRKLFAVGGQSILWWADDADNPDLKVLARMALLPYHRPAYLSVGEIKRARARIEREAYLLTLFSDSPFPRLHGLYYGPNPLHPPERGDAITKREPYLVMERMAERQVVEWTRRWIQKVGDRLF